MCGSRKSAIVYDLDAKEVIYLYIAAVFASPSTPTPLDAVPSDCAVNLVECARGGAYEVVRAIFGVLASA